MSASGEAQKTSEISLIPLTEVERENVASGMEANGPPTEVQLLSEV